MKSSKKRWFSGVLVVCMMLSMVLSNSAQATVTSSEYLDWYRTVLTPQSEGKIAITVSVEGCGKMTMLGASKIYFYESSDGISFSCVETYKYEDYPEMMGSGWNYHKAPVTYDGTPGYAYYAIAYCYAGNSKGHDEKPYTTAIVYARG